MRGQASSCSGKEHMHYLSIIILPMQGRSKARRCITVFRSHNQSWPVSTLFSSLRRQQPEQAHLHSLLTCCHMQSVDRWEGGMGLSPEASGPREVPGYFSHVLSVFHIHLNHDQEEDRMCVRAKSNAPEQNIQHLEVDRIS